jgi:hypothetical protein
MAPVDDEQNHAPAKSRPNKHLHAPHAHAQTRTLTLGLAALQPLLLRQHVKACVDVCGEGYGYST